MNPNRGGWGFDRTLWTVLFFWMYGVPFLLLVTLIRRTASLNYVTVVQARAFDTVTDAYLWVAVVVDIAVPVVGVGVALVRGREAWVRRFAVAFGCSLVMLFGLGVVAARPPATPAGARSTDPPKWYSSDT